MSKQNISNTPFCVASCKGCVPEDDLCPFLETHEQLFSERKKKSKYHAVCHHAVCCQNKVGDQLRGLALI